MKKNILKHEKVGGSNLAQTFTVSCLGYFGSYQPSARQPVSPTHLSHVFPALTLGFSSFDTPLDVQFDSWSFRNVAGKNRIVTLAECLIAGIAQHPGIRRFSQVCLH